MKKSKTKANSITSIPLAELVEDMDVYPRHAVDPSHVQNLALALEAGVQLPPIVADAKSKRITDGWHRARAYKRILGPDAVVDVELIAYGSERELMMDAVQRNATHGRRLDRIDQTRAVLMLQEQGCADTEIAVIMRVPASRVEKLKIKVVEAASAANGNIPGTKRIALKRSVRHLEGGKFDRKQAEAHKSMPGTSFLLIAKQLTLAIRSKFVNCEDDKLMAQLKELHTALGTIV